MKRENENNNIEVKLKSEYYNNHDVENIQRREEEKNGMLIGCVIGFLLFLVIFILIVLFVK